MAINMTCWNSNCKHYFEDLCMKNLSEEHIHINENGNCETFEHGINEGYSWEDTIVANGRVLAKITDSSEDECIRALRETADRYNLDEEDIAGVLDKINEVSNTDLIISNEALTQALKYASENIESVVDKLNSTINAI